MFNQYTLILGLFTIAGILTALWGLNIMLKARKTLRWPKARGIIEQSKLNSNNDDLLPKIEFSYTVNDKTYRSELQFPEGVTPTQEFSKFYTGKFPTGKAVEVSYDPHAPSNATLEPGLGRGDWLVFALGIGAAIFGGLFLLLGG